MQSVADNAWAADLFRKRVPPWKKCGNFPFVRDLTRQRKPTYGIEMTQVHSSVTRRRRSGGAPLFVAIAVAIVGTLSILIVDYGPWNKPKVQPAIIAHYSTTGEAARAAGAEVKPTDPKLQVEPDPAGPKPIHPANPTPR